MGYQKNFLFSNFSIIELISLEVCWSLLALIPFFAKSWIKRILIITEPLWISLIWKFFLSIISAISFFNLSYKPSLMIQLQSIYKPTTGNKFNFVLNNGIIFSFFISINFILLSSSNCAKDFDFLFSLIFIFYFQINWSCFFI